MPERTTSSSRPLRPPVSPHSSLSLGSVSLLIFSHLNRYFSKRSFLLQRLTLLQTMRWKMWEKLPSWSAGRNLWPPSLVGWDHSALLVLFVKQEHRNNKKNNLSLLVIFFLFFLVVAGVSISRFFFAIFRFYANLVVTETQLLSLNSLLCCHRLPCGLHPISRGREHGANPAWHGHICYSERPPTREVVQHQHLRGGGQPGERAHLHPGQHQWGPTSWWEPKTLSTCVRMSSPDPGNQSCEQQVWGFSVGGVWRHLLSAPNAMAPSQTSFKCASWFWDVTSGSEVSFSSSGYTHLHTG